MSKEKKQEIHVHHHYAAPRAAPRRRSRKKKMRRPKKKPNQFKDVKKAISISVNIVEQLLRLK